MFTDHALMIIRKYFINRRYPFLLLFLLATLVYWFTPIGTFSSIEIDNERIFRSANYTYLNKDIHVTKLQSTFSCHGNGLRVLIVVTSNVSAFHRRETIRRTWGQDLNPSQHHHSDDFKTFFAVGKSFNDDITVRLQKEVAEFKDIIIGDFYENFYNLPRKFEIIIEWAYKHCRFEYLLKMDDDVFINLPNLFKMIEENKLRKDGVYAGRAQFTSRALRTGKYAVTRNEYAKKYYPPFVGGGAAIFSYDVVRKIIPYFFEIPFKLDDIYIAMLVRNIALQPTHLSNIWTVERHCYYDDIALALHFQDRRKKSSDECMTELFYKMLAGNLKDKFVQMHYLHRSFSKNL